MHQNPIPPVVLAAALSACAFQPELLNSERIERRFGIFGIEVLEQDSSVRRSSLFSTENGVQTCRTYAVVKFVDPAITELGAAHTAVLAGQSIGATFKSAGWEINKATIHVGDVMISDPRHAVGEIMNLDAPANLSLHVYQLMLGQESQSIHYATIIELHHPSYLSRNELLELYPVDAEFRLESDEVETLVRLVLGQD